MKVRERTEKKIVEEMIKRNWNSECMEINVYRWFGRRNNERRSGLCCWL